MSAISIKWFLSGFILFSIPLMGVACGSGRIQAPERAEVNPVAARSNTPIANVSNANANANLYAMDATTPPETKTVRVPANVEWFNTGIVLQEGQKFMSTAEGKWS